MQKVSGQITCNYNHLVTEEKVQIINKHEKMSNLISGQRNSCQNNILHPSEHQILKLLVTSRANEGTGKLVRVYRYLFGGESCRSPKISNIKGF